MSFFILFLISLFISAVHAGVGALDETPKTKFNADLSNLELLVLSNVEKTILTKYYSKFIEDLTSNGHKITFKTFNSFSQESELNLTLYDEFIYDNILIFDINISKYRSSLPISYIPKLLDYIDKGNNVMVFVDTLDENNHNIDISRGMSKLARECAGIRFLPGNTNLFDVSNENLLEIGSVYSNNCLNSSAVFSFGTCENKGILYHGVGFSLDTPNNELIVPILRASDTCFSLYNSIKSKSLNLFRSGIYLSTGEEIGLVVSMQARNNARVLFSSDGKLCSDSTIKKNSINRKFCTDILLWSFQQKGLIKIEDVVHYKLNNDSKALNEHYDETLMYTVEDAIFFSAKFYHFINKKWEIYPLNDIQLEFTMLDPYIRTFLQLNQTNPQNVTFSTIFKIPEIWGVFKFVINHNRIGYNGLSYESLSTVRNFRHDQNPRFVISAYPYYATFIVTLILFSYFVSMFIFSHRNYAEIKSKIE